MNQHKKTILFVIEQANTGGLYRCNYNMAVALKDRFNLYTVYGEATNTNSIAYKHQWKNIVKKSFSLTIFYTNSQIQTFINTTYKYLIFFLKNLPLIKPELVITNLPASTIALKIACLILKLNPTTIHILHGYLKEDLLTQDPLNTMNPIQKSRRLFTLCFIHYAQKIALRSVKYRLTYSNYAHRIITSKLKCNSIHFNPPVITPKFNQIVHSPFSPNKINIIIANRIEPRKGIHLAIKAAYLLRHYPHIHFHFMGHIMCDHYFLNLFKYQMQKHLYHNITWYGLLPHRTVQRYIYHSDILLMPSTIGETLGFSTLEAIKHKVIVIGSNSGATLEILSNISNKLLFKNNSSKSLANAILKIAKLPKKETEHLKHAGVELINTKYSTSQFIKFFKLIS